ncbi:MAG: TonB-dependent receptor domain-containing protein [Flavobacteriales bacterium]
MILFLLPLTAQAQDGGSLIGVISHNNETLVGTSVSIPSLGVGANSNKDGNYALNGLISGKHVVKIKMLGYLPITDTITISEGETLTRNYDLKKDLLLLSEFVISGSRNLIPRQESPVLINSISSKTLSNLQSNSIADGLSFSPGLRLENNCQNCGFTQVRMNGLEGPYTQILINSRPVFSALAGVYGLEMIPPNMVERLEVIRGAGSVLYGGNAIAGTLNIITKEPIQNSFEASINQAYIMPDTPDRTVSLNGSLVNKKLNKGVRFFAFNRNRNAWDANGDGFSELTKIRNSTMGLDAYYQIHERSKLKAGLFYIHEFRRGGSDMELLPHQSRLAKQAKHKVLSSNVSYEAFSRNLKNKFSIYSSLQHIQRDSYYGVGGRILMPGDTLTETDMIALNAYGESQDLSWVSGVQFNRTLNKNLSLISGIEHIQNDVKDRMIGYGRKIEQQTNASGTYAELTYKGNRNWQITAGARNDLLHINGVYNLGDERFVQQKAMIVPVPRISTMYQWNENWAWRATLAQGYRGPQAFDEDLHIETVGGNARFIRLAEDLKTEKSNSLSMSISHEKSAGKRQLNIVLEAFYTQLLNPFILTDLEEISTGVSVLTKRNASGASVGGFNMEANFAFGEKIILQSGATIQYAQYDQNETLWSPDDELGENEVSTKRILRTPNSYGYAHVTYRLRENIAFYYSAIYTGKMLLTHMVDPETERIELKETPRFFEHNIKISYTLKRTKSLKYEIHAGVHNISNSFQRDFDRGAERDAGYVYGPVRPRTVFFGIRMGLGT